MDFPLILFYHIKLVQASYFIIQCENESHYPVMTHFSSEGVALELTCQNRVDTIIPKQCVHKYFQSPTHHKHTHIYIFHFIIEKIQSLAYDYA